MRIPTDKEIRRLHERHAPSDEALELVYTHCEIVCAVAEQLHGRTGSGIDLDQVRAGALLHDIGVYRLYDEAGRLDYPNYIRHGILGHELLAEEGFPESFCRFASCHTGVGLTADDITRQGLPIPVGDYVAETGEEELVMYADKFHSKSIPPTFYTADAYTERVRKFGDDKARAFKKMRGRFGEPDLDTLCGAYGHRLIEAGAKIRSE